MKRVREHALSNPHPEEPAQQASRRMKAPPVASPFETPRKRGSSSDNGFAVARG